MLYLGGKGKIARRLAAVINAERGAAPIWEPFCGGAHMSMALGGTVWASDINEGLIALYNAVRRDPCFLDTIPDDPTLEDWTAAKALPASHPLSAFYGFGCSRSGMFFRSPMLGRHNRHQPGSTDTFAQGAKNVLRRTAACSAIFVHDDFFAVPPEPGVIGYLDPPYRGTTGYGMAFDHDRFYGMVDNWAARGSLMFVSEYAFPLGDLIWSCQRTSTAAMKQGGSARTENLYRIGGRK